MVVAALERRFLRRRGGRKEGRGECVSGGD